MEITIQPGMCAKATLDLKKFKTDFQKSFNLKKSIYKNLKITDFDSKVADIKTLKEMVYLQINWTQVLKLWSSSRQDVMSIKIIKVEITSGIHYIPDTANGTTGKFTFNEQEVNCEQYMVVHNFIPLVEHQFENLLALNILDYSEEQFKKIYK